MISENTGSTSRAGTIYRHDNASQGTYLLHPMEQTFIIGNYSLLPVALIAGTKDTATTSAQRSCRTVCGGIGRYRETFFTGCSILEQRIHPPRLN